jgi:NADH:ubiquinone oxidoreductase subunit 5 (subunit L)/multisubunit Na+/H+ antiporter MnhA subunit
VLNYSIVFIKFFWGDILLIGAPVTVKYFIYEHLLGEKWFRSHYFLILVLVCLSLNSIHVFRIGHRAFLGEAVTE